VKKWQNEKQDPDDDDDVHGMLKMLADRRRHEATKNPLEGQFVSPYIKESLLIRVQ
jgi:hypothetical protein